MRIPDGDLVPRRRRSRYGGGYGRRRRTRTVFTVGAVVLLLAGAGWWFGLPGGDPPRVAALQPCPTPATSSAAPTASLPAARSVRVALLNGTTRNGLAHTVAAQLRTRGFVVTSEGNASGALGGASTVSYGPGGLGAATVLVRHVHGARLVSVPTARPGSVVLVLGGDYQRLATPAEVTAQARPAGGQVAVPAPTRSPCSP